MPKVKRRTPRVSLNFPEQLARSFEEDFRAFAKAKARSSSFKDRYLSSEIFSKYLDERIVPASERAQSAIDKWLTVENLNRKTNQRLYEAQCLDIDFGWTTFESLLNKIRHIVAEVLGSYDYDRLVCLTNHSNGASTRVRRGPLGSCLKFSGTAHCSQSAITHWSRLVENTRLRDQNVVSQENSVMFTVPKKTEIDRVACKEPEVNMLLQRSCGRYIRKALKKRANIDLRDQSRNRYLAKIGVSAGLATVDLSSASDTVTKQFVSMVLPWEYYCLLDDLRVKETALPDGTIHQLEMFSSMGNGFTFELESLLFYAVTRATAWLSGVKGTISVYGDDIIAPCALIPRLQRVLAFFGFSMNLKKTAYTGSFRESCGGHYDQGFDVSPFYIRKAVSSMTDVIRILNRLYEWDARGVGFMSDPSAIKLHKKWSSHVPKILHGGVDPERTDALVTGHKPNARIVEEPLIFRGSIGKLPLKVDGHGQLMAWLVSREVSCDVSYVSRVTMNVNRDILRTTALLFRDELIDTYDEITHWKTGRARVARQSKWVAPHTDQIYIDCV